VVCPAQPCTTIQVHTECSPVHQLPKVQNHHDHVGSSEHTTDELHRDQEAGPAAPLGPAEPPGPTAPAQHIQVCHQASVTLGSTARNDPDQGNKVGLIQRLRLASLGFVDPQASEQPTWDNIQEFIYPLEHISKWMTRGPRADRTKRTVRTSFTQKTNPQPPSNRLKDQITDARSKAVEITGLFAPGDTTAPPCSALQLPLSYKYPLLQPPTHWGYI
jgi:hypothetical protein